MSFVLNKEWFNSVKAFCIIRNIKISDIDPNNVESLKVLQGRIAASG